MKHPCANTINSAIYRAKESAQDKLFLHQHANYDFGKDGVAVYGYDSDIEYRVAKNKTIKKLQRDMSSATELGCILDTMVMDEQGLYAEKDFYILLNKVDDSGRRLSDMEYLAYEIGNNIIPEIVRCGIEQYASACVDWLFNCKNYNQAHLLDSNTFKALEAMAQSHKLKSDFCVDGKLKEQKVAAL